MSDLKILSKDEVDALLQVSQDNNFDLGTVTADNKSEEWKEDNCTINTKSLNNIAELTPAESEKVFTSFLRKKVTLKRKASHITILSEQIKDKIEKHVFTSFKQRLMCMHAGSVLPKNRLGHKR